MKRTHIMAVVAAAVLTFGAARAADQSELLDLAPAQFEGLALRFAPAQATREYLVATLPAVIAPPPGARIAVAATFPGTVLQTLVVEGDPVRRGQTLAVIASREILTLSAELVGARARLAAASANAKRQATLSDEGIVAGVRAEEAGAAYMEAQAEVDEKSRMLAAVSADGAKGTYALTSPIDGTVARASLETGAPIESMTAAFIVDADGRYEVQAQVPERLMGEIAPGMRVMVDGKIAAEVTSVGKAVQPETRSAGLKAAIADTKGLVAGRTATAAVYAAAPAGAVKVPRASVTELEGEPVVFVRAKNGLLVRRVTAAPVAGNEAVILAGLKSGDEVVVSNLSELKTLALAK